LFILVFWLCRRDLVDRGADRCVAARDHSRTRQRSAARQGQSGLPGRRQEIHANPRARRLRL